MNRSTVNNINTSWYINIVYVMTFLSGASGLIFQVVWQRYLSSLVGSEARSVSLVVAVFLLGLALGYYFWGNFTETRIERKYLLRIYGRIEVVIGIYAIVFPLVFGAIKQFSYYVSNFLIFDFVLAVLLLLLPTFLMGATIPLLTKVVPESMEDVNSCHTKIYGINTLGAFFGTFVSGFV